MTDAPIKETTFSHQAGRHTSRYWGVAVDGLGQEGEPSAPVWFNQSYKGFSKAIGINKASGRFNLPK